GVRVLLGGTAMGCPARVPDPGRAAERLLAEEVREAIELSDAPPDLDVVVLEDREAGGVIAPVLELPESAHQDRARVTRPDVADDATHGSAPPPRPSSRRLGLPGVRSPDGGRLRDRLGRRLGR